MVSSFVGRFSVLIAAIWLASSPIATAQPTIEQVDQALDLAEKAARHQLTELSMQAVTRALRFGLPTVSIAAPEPPLRHFGARVDTSKPLPKTAQEKINLRIPATVEHLASLWGQSAKPEDVYGAVRDVVLPSDRPRQAFLYGQPIKLDPLQPDRIPPVSSLADLLLDWATKADQLTDLRQQLVDRDLKLSIPGMVVGLMVGLELDDSRLVQQYSEDISRSVKFGISRQAAEYLVAVGVKLRRESRSPKVAATLLEDAGRALQKIDQLEQTKNSIGPTVLLLAARSWFSLGDSAKGVSLLKEFLGDAATNDLASSSETRRIDVVGNELFSRGLMKEGRELLGPKHSPYFERRYNFSAGSNSATAEWEPPSELEETRLARVIPFSNVDSQPNLANQIWLCSLDLNTNTSKRLFSLPDFQHAASPAVSPDGKRLCFEATFPGEAITSGSRIYIVELSSGKLRRLGRGTMPSWSPGGKRIVFSAFLPSRGIWISSLSAGDSRLIDGQGWAATWSPNGNMIAYSKSQNGQSDLHVFDIIENEFFKVVGNQQRSFKMLNRCFQWAPDSQSLLVLQSNHLVQIPVLNSGESKQIPFGFEHQDQFALHQNGKLVGPGKTVKSSPEQLFVLDLNQSRAFESVLPGQLKDRRNTSASWMPDGQSLIFISKPIRK